MTSPFLKFICTSCHPTNASIPTQPSPIHSQPNNSPIITLPSINSSVRTYPPTNTVTNPLPQQSTMITLHSIDRKLDIFKQTLDTITIKQDNTILSDINKTLQHQLDFLQIATYDIIRFHFHNIDQTSQLPQYHLLTKIHALPTNHYKTNEIYLISQTTYINLLIIFTLIHDSKTNILHLNYINLRIHITR